MDPLDLASEHELVERAALIADRPRYCGVTPSRCAECDARIPEARAVAVPGTYLCVECAGEREAS